jgi:hypothetical protein
MPPAARGLPPDRHTHTEPTDTRSFRCCMSIARSWTQCAFASASPAVPLSTAPARVALVAALLPALCRLSALASASPLLVCAPAASHLSIPRALAFSPVSSWMATSASSGSSIRPYIAPSMLSSDFSQFGAECERIRNAGAEWLHMDVMVRLALLVASQR